MKGVILGGGFGTRMQPASLSINKHLLPIYSEINGSVPMIFYPIHTLVKSGITEILIITSDESAGLMIETLGDGKAFNCDFTYKIQNMHNPQAPIGIAGALKLSKNFVGQNNFCVILGDNFFEESFKDDIFIFESKNNYLSKIFLKEVNDPHRFGVATVKDDKVIKLVEKPKEPESKLASTGIYFFNPNVFPIADSLKVSNRGELEIVDIHNHYISHNLLTYRIINGYWHDTGTPKSMRETEKFINENKYTIKNEN